MVTKVWVDSLSYDGVLRSAARSAELLRGSAARPTPAGPTIAIEGQGKHGIVGRDHTVATESSRRLEDDFP